MMVSGALFSMALRPALYPAMKSKFSAKTKLSKQFALSTVNSSEVNAGLPSLHVRGATDTVIPQGVQVAGVPGAAGLALNVSLLAGARGASSSYPGIYIYMGLRVEALDFRL